MKRTTIIPTVSVLIALVCATLFCLSWNPEPLLKGKEQPVTLSDIEQNLITDFSVTLWSCRPALVCAFRGIDIGWMEAIQK